MAALDDQLAVNLLKRLDTSDVKLLLEASTSLKSLKSADVDPVVDEFAKDVSDALGISAGPAQLMTLLESAFSGEEIGEILGRPRSKIKENVWQKLDLGKEMLVAPYLLDQHEQVAALVVSRIQPDLAARCMAMFPRSTRNRIARRLVNISEVHGPSLEMLEETLLEDLFSKAQQQKSSEGRNLLAAVINKLDRAQSLEVLEDLGNSNPEELIQLRKLIFMFEDIALLEAKNRMKLIDRIPAELVISALFGMDAEFREKFLSSMSARTKRMVESELQGDISQPTKDTMTARRKIADIAILMAQKDELILPDAKSGNDSSVNDAAEPDAAD